VPACSKYQQRLPYDLLCSLANALLDGTVFEIVNSLKEVQQLEERNLFNQRIRLVNEGRGQLSWRCTSYSYDSRLIELF